jgi:phosphoribosylformimino-5-aminoimidazole carboxamide ribotide isomerase
LEQLASKTNLKIDFGGGLKSDADLKVAFECGASQITGGSIAVKNPELLQHWLATYGSDRIILGADQNKGKIAVSGWTETSELELVPFIQAYILKGITTVICTDISKDGMLQGPNVELYQQLITEIPKLQLIASGGVTHLSDLQKVAAVGCEGAIIGKAIYEGIITLKQLEQYILSPKSFESC